MKTMSVLDYLSRDKKEQISHTNGRIITALNENANYRCVSNYPAGTHD